jgi:hypothetical protein
MQSDLGVIESLKALSDKSESRRRIGPAELLANALLELDSDAETGSPIGLSGKPDAVDRCFGL